MGVNEREIILESLLEINENGRLSHTVLKEVLDKYDYLPPESKAFIKRVSEGTVEKLISIDETIDLYSKVKVSKQKPLIRTLLRMSTYQILYMDKVPHSAVCNEAVKLAKKRGFSGLSGFVNGVLRNISKNSKDIGTDKEDVPGWIKEHLVSCYGEDKTKLIIEDINKIHPVTVRVRNDEADTSMMKPTGVLKDAFYLKERTSPADVPGFDDGDFVIQDIASMFVAIEGKIKPDEDVLDVCAAPGGKAMHAFDMGANVTACDVSERKVLLIDQNAGRCIRTDKDHTFTTRVLDATEFEPEYEKKFDVVLADVPCSGLGVMGRKADIRHKTKKEDLETLPGYQKKIIDNTIRYVKDGGRYIYSTCTMNPKENEENARYIADRYGYKIFFEKQYLPGVDPCDGFYIAVLLQKDNGVGIS